jgi:uncharacterized protein YcbX
MAASPAEAEAGVRPSRVDWLSVAPVKALRVVEVDELQLETYGVRENRAFYVVDRWWRLMNDARLPPLAQVAARYDEAAGTLELRFPDGLAVAGEVALGRGVTTNFWGRPVRGKRLVGPWSEALSSFTGKRLHLVRPTAPGSGVDRGARGAVSLVSRASLTAFARAAGLEGDVDRRRFRMLVGLDGPAEHEEDGWVGRRVRLGEALVIPRGHVGRCAVTTLNPETGVRDLDVLRVITQYRGTAPRTERLPFGVWGEVVEPGRVRVGDVVQVD